MRRLQFQLWQTLSVDIALPQGRALVTLWEHPEILRKAKREGSMRRMASNPRHQAILYAVFAALLFSAALAVAAQKKSAPGSVASILAQDKGKFSIVLDGKTVGHEDFEIAPSGGGWTAKGTTDIKPPDAASATRVMGTLILQPDGAPISDDWSSRDDKTNGPHIHFANGFATITLPTP